MPEPDYHQNHDVSTEPQRQALDEMSRQLVERLNEMVREQHERAWRFAASQHSLSSQPNQVLPELPQTPAIPLPEEPEPTQEPEPLPAAPAERKKKNRIPFLPQRNAQPKQPQDFSAPAAPSTDNWRTLRKKASQEAAKSEESGCGTVPTLILIVIIIILLRACS